MSTVLTRLEPATRDSHSTKWLYPSSPFPVCFHVMVGFCPDDTELALIVETRISGQPIPLASLTVNAHEYSGAWLVCYASPVDCVNGVRLVVQTSALLDYGLLAYYGAATANMKSWYLAKQLPGQTTGQYELFNLPDYAGNS